MIQLFPTRIGALKESILFLKSKDISHFSLLRILQTLGSGVSPLRELLWAREKLVFGGLVDTAQPTSPELVSTTLSLRLPYLHSKCHTSILRHSTNLGL